MVKCVFDRNCAPGGLPYFPEIFTSIHLLSLNSGPLVKTVFTILFTFLFTGLPYGDDNNDIYSNDDYEDVGSATANDDADRERVIHELPHFTTTGESMLVNEGSTIKLPCIVNRLGRSSFALCLLASRVA